MSNGLAVLCLGVLMLALAPVGAAQQDPKQKDPPDAPAPKQGNAPQKHQNAVNTTIEVLGRRSVFFPNIATSVGPLSSKQKFELFADETVAPSRFLSSAAGAGISQARNSRAGYGQEAGGYGKRFGSSMATAAANNFFGTFVISSLLHRDPRYFATLHGGAGHRIGYALSRIVVARTDDGKDSANCAGILADDLSQPAHHEERSRGEIESGGYRAGSGSAIALTNTDGTEKAGKYYNG